MKKYEKAVAKAEKYLVSNPKPAHGLSHHQRVWENARKINKTEKLDLDRNILKVSCFWHDVIVSTIKKESIEEVIEVVDYLKKQLPELGFTEAEIREITVAIMYHEFGSKPRNLSGKVLQDADKLDVVSMERFIRLHREFINNKVSREFFLSLMESALDWLPEMEKRFHFNYSKKLFKKRVKLFLNSKRFKKICSELGLQDKYLKTFERLTLMYVL